MISKTTFTFLTNRCHRVSGGGGEKNAEKVDGFASGVESVPRGATPAPRPSTGAIRSEWLASLIRGRMQQSAKPDRQGRNWARSRNWRVESKRDDQSSEVRDRPEGVLGLPGPISDMEEHDPGRARAWYRPEKPPGGAAGGGPRGLTTV